VRRAAGAWLLALAALACRRPAPAPTTPEGAALAAFTPAGAALVPHGDADAAGALRRLAEAREARVVGAAPLPEGAVAVDVEASLGDGARGRYAIHVARRDDGTWRVVAIGGPGIAWPPRPLPPAEGLSESAPPR
jgi:hypothetical protein